MIQFPPKPCRALCAFQTHSSMNLDHGNDVCCMWDFLHDMDLASLGGKKLHFFAFSSQLNNVLMITFLKEKEFPSNINRLIP